MNTDPVILAIGEALWDILPAGRRLGGAPLNFAIQCHKMGHRALVASRVGNDDLGRELIHAVRQLGLDDSRLQRDPHHPTGVVHIEIDSEGVPTYTIARPAAYDYLAWDDEFARAARSAAWICYGTLAQREATTRKTLERILANGASATTICDLNLRLPLPTAELIESALSSCRWLKINESEMAHLDRLFHLPGETVSSRLTHLRRRFGIDLVALTRGPLGCYLQSEGSDLEVPGVPVQVRDTVGAGDTFLAGLVTGVQEGLPLQDAAVRANQLAANQISGGITV